MILFYTIPSYLYAVLTSIISTSAIALTLYQKNRFRKKEKLFEQKINEYNLILQTLTLELELCKKKLANTEEIKRQQSIIRGLQCFINIYHQDKIISLPYEVFSDVVRFYRLVDGKFIAKLMSSHYHLSTLEMVICIFFRIGLSHRHVAELLGNSSETLARSKTRIKKEKLRIHSKNRLEDIIISF